MLTKKSYQKMKGILSIGTLCHCTPLFVASIARGVGSRTLIARNWLSCAEFLRPYK